MKEQVSLTDDQQGNGRDAPLLHLCWISYDTRTTRLHDKYSHLNIQLAHMISGSDKLVMSKKMTKRCQPQQHV